MKIAQMKIATAARALSKSTMALGLAAAAALAGLGAADAQARSQTPTAKRHWGAERINCPVDSLKRRVNTRLPKGWRAQHWSPLSKVEIVGPGPSRDRIALVCDYGEAGTIKKYVAAHRECWTVGKHFMCDAGYDHRPPYDAEVYSKGSGWLKRSGKPWDLDGARETSTYRADLRLGRLSDRRYVLRPMNGARIWRPGPNRAKGFARCAAGGEAMFQIALRDLPKGGELCVRTAEGRLGKVTVIQNKPWGKSRLKVSFKVWEDRWADVR